MVDPPYPTAIWIAEGKKCGQKEEKTTNETNDRMSHPAGLS
jgi:hypothetical protein